MLKSNLLELTRDWAPTYDENYDSAFFATHSYLEMEMEILRQEIQMLDERSKFLDLGCATGRLTIPLAQHFQAAIGYDISVDMLQLAREKVAGEECNRICFKDADVELGIPEKDNSVSLVVMNLGTASDVKDIKIVLDETRRVLRKDGRFFFSFYNEEALVYRWDFLPWEASLAAEINVHKHCLDVHIGNKVRAVYARPYKVEAVRDMIQGVMTTARVSTYPTISSILPNDLLADQPLIQEAIAAIDRSLTDLNLGAYIIVTGKK